MIRPRMKRCRWLGDAVASTDYIKEQRGECKCRRLDPRMRIVKGEGKGGGNAE
jgi:hypothetical protein